MERKSRRMEITSVNDLDARKDINGLANAWDSLCYSFCCCVVFICSRLITLDDQDVERVGRGKNHKGHVRASSVTTGSQRQEHAPDPEAEVPSYGTLDLQQTPWKVADPCWHRSQTYYQTLQNSVLSGHTYGLRPNSKFHKTGSLPSLAPSVTPQAFLKMMF